MRANRRLRITTHLPAIVMISTDYQKRFIELAEQYKALTRRPNGDGTSGFSIATGEWKRWATSAQSLIRAIFAEDSPHYRNFLNAFNSCNGYEFTVDGLHGVFLSAKDDFEGGYVFNADLQVSGEVFGDFVVMAKHALREGHTNVAAVLACSALEDTLKRYGIANGLDVDGKVMQEVIAALKSKGLVTGAQKSLLDSMPKIRDYAMHANWEKITPPDVNSVIGFVEQFLITKFSP